MKKLLALATTLTLLFTVSIPVLADDATSTTNSNQAATSQSSLTDKATKANQHQFQQYMEPIRDLQKQEKQIREQIHSIRNQIHQQMKSDKKAKNYTALSTALGNMASMQDDIIGVTNASKTCLTDWQQYYTDRQAKNIDKITADLLKLQDDIKITKIPAMQKVLADLQKVSEDLNLPAPAITSSTTTPTT